MQYKSEPSDTTPSHDKDLYPLRYFPFLKAKKKTSGILNEHTFEGIKMGPMLN